MQSNPPANVSLQQLKQAVAIREKIDDLEKERSRITGGRSPGVKIEPSITTTRTRK
jgi:hypothetical protein